MSRLAMVSLVLSLAAPAAGAGAPSTEGTSEWRIELADTRLTAFIYRPACRDPSLLLVFHGQSRNADDYRDWARPLAARHCMLVVAPRFSKSQFPSWRYQHGGLVHGTVVQDPSEWTGRLVPELAERIQQLEGRKMPYFLISHSGGSQFLSRLAAFSSTEAQRIVISNAGTHVLPDPKVEAPYGFGGVYASEAVDQQLGRYLSAPITIFLGLDDTDEDDGSSEADAQGATRYERGLNAFKSAQALALSRGWPFNWRLVEVPGVGHRASKMFAAPEASRALMP